MSRLPHGGASVPLYGYPQGHPQQHPPPGNVPMYADPYGSYRAAPGQQAQFTHEGYNAVAGPSRDPYMAAYGRAQHGAPGPGGDARWMQQAQAKGGVVGSVPVPGVQGVQQGGVGGPGVGGVKVETGAHGGPVGGSPMSAIQHQHSQSSLPPTQNAQADAQAQSSNNAAASATGSGGQQPGPSEFIKKLYKMLEDESAQFGRGKPAGAPRGKGERGSVGWGRGGTSFVVWDMNEFTTKILPQTFRHSNFSSFVRQLNKYGFSKIKHVDEETGQIKENVWEFQHDKFQAGGKADLDSIKRKAVVPKKGANEERDGSPAARGMTAEDAQRIVDMEGRMAGLEDALIKTQVQLRDARARESGMVGLLRNVIAHLAATDKEPGPTEDSNVRIGRLVQQFEQMAQAAQAGGIMHAHPMAGSAPSYAQVAPPLPYPNLPFPGVARLAMPPLHNAQGPLSATSNLSPRQDGSPRSGQSPSARAGGPPSAGPSALGATAPVNAAIVSPSQQHQQQQQPQQQRNIKKEPVAPASQQQPTYNGAMAQYDEVNNQWVDNSGGPAGASANGAMAGRSQAGASLHFMVDGGIPPAVQSSQQSVGSSSAMPVDDSASVDAANSAAAAVAATGVSAAAAAAAAPTDPTGQQQQLGQPAQANANGTRQQQVERRSSSIKPSWTQTPRILVVEDDVVYRQLSSRFLEKFGCVVEAVENAQQGVEKMNTTKYDLVLMDIFFGPNMDGRKATSLIRQFDSYTPIISMTSNVQTKDVDSYMASGMNDVLAKPFTKHGLFGILDKHLIHLKAIQLSGEVPRFLGVPPLSDQGVVDAITTGAQQWETSGGDSDALSNPLAGSGWPDSMYQMVLQQYLATGAMPDMMNATVTLPDGTTTVSATALPMTPVGAGVLGSSFMFPDGTNVGNGVFGTAMGRKRSIENVEDWEEANGKSKRHVTASGSITEMA